MKGIAKRLRVTGKNVKLTRWDPASTPGCRTREEAEQRLVQNLERIDRLQYLLHCEERQSLLIVLQGMDTSGKDGLIRRVMAAFNPQGCHVWPFKAPTAVEAAHDFLWRIHLVTPARGNVAIFNRSHYEDVLVVRVHDLVPKRVWSGRYRSINRFETHLHQHDTRMLKFYLHISRKTQKERLLERLEEPDKNWKFNEGDLDERKYWPQYQRAYEDVLSRCSPSHAPWYVIPADHKWYRNLAVSEIVADTLEDMDPKPKRVRLNVAKLRARLLRA